MTTAAVFAAIWIALWTSHQVADHWVQTSCQATDKSLPGWPGRLACGRHVAGHVVVTVLVLLALNLVGVTVHIGATAAGTAVIAVTHFWADRRAPLRKLATKLGKEGFYLLGMLRQGGKDIITPGTGAYSLDQTWHFLWLFIAALLMAALS